MKKGKRRIHHHAANKVRELFAKQKPDAGKSDEDSSGITNHGDNESPPSPPPVKAPPNGEYSGGSAQNNIHNRNDNDSTPYERSQLRLARWMAGATVAIAAATIIYMIVSIYQYRKVMQSVDSAREANRINRDLFVSLQRAYVTVNGVQIEPFQFSGQREAYWHVSPIVVNNGNTPTKNLKWAAVVPTVVPNDRSSEPIVPQQVSLESASLNPLTLAPKQEMRSFPIGGFPAKYTEAVRRQDARVYIDGLFLYEDVVSDQIHITRFCYFLWGISYAKHSHFQLFAMRWENELCRWRMRRL